MSSSMRVWNIAAALAMIVVVALGWFLGISPKLAEASRLESERNAVQEQNEISRIQIAQLEQDASRMSALRADLAELRAAFPTQAEYDSAVESLFALIAEQGMILEGVAIAEPISTVPTVLGPDEVLPEPPVSEAGTLPAGSLLLVSTTLSVQGSLTATIALVDALQRSDRFAIVPLWSYSRGEADGQGSAAITLNLYVVAGEALQGVEANPTEPEPSPTAEPTSEPTEPASSTTPTPSPTP